MYSPRINHSAKGANTKNLPNNNTFISHPKFLEQITHNELFKIFTMQQGSYNGTIQYGTVQYVSQQDVLQTSLDLYNHAPHPQRYV